MKVKLNSQFVLFAVFILLAAVIVFASCKEPSVTVEKTYAVTMEYDSEAGTASASPNRAVKGTKVTITAAPLSNYKFKSWEIIEGEITLTHINTNPATFTMPGETVTIKAVFEPLADITLDEVVYGYVQPAKKNITITDHGINTQTVTGIVMEKGDESSFVLDATDITNKITTGNVPAFFILPKANLKAGSYTDTVVITHSGGKTTTLGILLTVNPKPLTVTGLSAQNKTYDNTTRVDIIGTAKIEGIIEGDHVVLGTYTPAFEDKNAGNDKKIVFSNYTLSGEDAQNYAITNLGIMANINPKVVTLRIDDGQPKTILIPPLIPEASYLGYDYQHSITVNFTVEDFVPGDTVTVGISENNIYGLSGETESGASGTITVSYNGTEVNSTTAVQEKLVVTGNYQLYSLSQPEFNVQIRDGLAPDRWLPVSEAKISIFNDYAVTADGLKRHYRLVENIILTKHQTGASNWTAIGTTDAEFTGSFNGNGFIIQNLTINSTGNNQGLFGVIAASGTVQNTALVDVDIIGSNSIGGLAGINHGTIQTSYVTGNVSGISYVGGLTGLNSGTIEDCYTTSRVSGSFIAGGVVGSNNKTVQYCYAIGVINGDNYIGGISGQVANDAKVNNCIALNKTITSTRTTPTIGRVVGSVNLQGLLANNYARDDMTINRTVISNPPRSSIDGETVKSESYRNTSWWTTSSNWNGSAWNSTTVWQMDYNILPKLIGAGGSQNHDIARPIIEMVWVSAGSFTMGSPDNETGRKNDEIRHTVNLDGYYIGRYEVTEQLYTSVIGPSNISDYPQSYVSWYEALVFCNKLSMQDDLSPAYSINGNTNPSSWGNVPTSNNATWNSVQIVAGSNGYRLPTEAQWEYACRAGTTTTYASGSSINGNICLYVGSILDNRVEFRITGVSFPNGWGISNMHGNVSEWCWDRYGAYSSSTQTNPMGSTSGTARVLRGGNARSSAADVRSAVRASAEPFIKDFYVGFRVVRPE